jgi:hypothetical protein
VDESGERRDDAPGDDDAADPDARADLMQNDVARNLEGEVAEEKYAGPDAVDAVTELEVAYHLQLGEADVDAVDVSDDVPGEQDRHKTPCDPAVERVAGAVGRQIRCYHGCLRSGAVYSLALG